MSQTLFGSNATPSLPLLDANFNDIYAVINFFSAGAFVGLTPKFYIDAGGLGYLGFNNSSPDRRVNALESTSLGMVARFVASESANTNNRGALEAVSAAATGSAADFGNWGTASTGWAARFYSNASRNSNDNVATSGTPVFLGGFRADGNFFIAPPATPPTISVNGQVAFNLTSNTNLRISARGSDGVTRVANITLA